MRVLLNKALALATTSVLVIALCLPCTAFAVPVRNVNSTNAIAPASISQLSAAITSAAANATTTKPPSPKTPYAGMVDSTTLRVNWTKVTGVSGYQDDTKEH